MIPFNRPPASPELAARLAEVASSGHHSGDGPMTRRAADLLAKYYPDAATILLTTSCTHALELSALTLDIRPGDEVIVPAFTFVSTANAFALRGARIRFAEILPDTLCVDPASVDALVTDRTRVIVPVHYAGVACELLRITAIASRVGAIVVEDNAHGLFAGVDGRPLGTFGSMSTLSFHETKNISAGEGGALVINDPALVPAAEIAREKGTNRSQFFRGMVDKYTWVGLGSSWLPSEFTAAVLVAALENAEVTQAARQRIWSTYHSCLSDWATTEGVRLPVVPPNCEQPAHIFYLLMPDLDARTRLIAHLADQRVQAVFHYVPLDTSPYGTELRGDDPDCPISRDVSERLVRLPLYPDLAAASVEHIVESIRAFRC
ncbi:MAG: dTDP-4-amino-4,6-dideoxygalactose transaminase [Acidimicrobiia bacterium]